MKTFEISKYPCHLDYIKLSSRDLCREINKYSLEFPRIRNQKVEWGIKFPVFLNTFYKYILVNNEILTQKDFFSYYLTENIGYFNSKKFNDEIIDCLKARIYRTYPSLVRDFHFSLYLKENFEQTKVIYNRNLDIKEGIDLLLVRDAKYYGLNLYTNTKRALFARTKKALRHEKFSNVKYVELPVDLKGSVNCGAFFLYGEKELNQIKRILN